MLDKKKNRVTAQREFNCMRQEYRGTIGPLNRQLSGDQLKQEEVYRGRPKNRSTRDGTRLAEIRCSAGACTKTYFGRKVEDEPPHLYL